MREIDAGTRAGGQLLDAEGTNLPIEPESKGILDTPGRCVRKMLGGEEKGNPIGYGEVALRVHRRADEEIFFNRRPVAVAFPQATIRELDRKIRPFHSRASRLKFQLRNT